MRRLFLICLMLSTMFGCIETLEFTLKSRDSKLVIESSISNVSFENSKNFPSDGRYFTVTLRTTRDIGQRVKDSLIVGAGVRLMDDLNNGWNYDDMENGTYMLQNDQFEAVNGRKYKLQVTYDEEVYESNWEQLPQENAPSLGDITFNEVEKATKTYPYGVEVIDIEKGIEVFTKLPINNSGAINYYRWDFTPIWHYKAPFAVKQYKNCWVTNELYLSDFTLQEDLLGGYNQKLFYIPVVGNDRVYENLSVLISQQVVTQDYYSFWKAMEAQANQSGVFDTPPSSLATNFKCITNVDIKPIGYFGVINESATRWYFNVKDLSYFVKNTLAEDCSIQYGRPETPEPPAPECLYCMFYTKGKATLTEPEWWITD